MVDVGIGMRDFLPTMTETHRVGLLFEVGVLAAGHFVEIDFRGAATRSRVERFVMGEDFFPIVGKLVDGVVVEAGVALVSAHGGVD